jgi:hypothetical protein
MFNCLIVVTTRVSIISKKFKRKGRRENTRGGPPEIKKEMITSCENNTGN